MVRIGLLSDTHGTLHPKVLHFFSEVDEIWHAGDMGSVKVADDLRKIKPLRAVFGNIDGTEIRSLFPKDMVFKCEEKKVLMTHIAGYPGHYDGRTRDLIERHRPDIVVCGHSHILKIIFNHRYNHLHINPGAAGNYGFHKSVTAVRFIIDGNNVKNMEVLDVGRRM